MRTCEAFLEGADARFPVFEPVDLRRITRAVAQSALGDRTEVSNSALGSQTRYKERRWSEFVLLQIWYRTCSGSVPVLHCALCTLLRPSNLRRTCPSCILQTLIRRKERWELDLTEGNGTAGGCAWAVLAQLLTKIC